jgi:glutamate carboxypeptidase
MTAARTPATTATMLAELEALVRVESPSADDAATEQAARLVDDLLLAHLGSRATWLAEGGRGHLLWSGGGPVSVLLVGHVDTVWPTGTVARWPFAVQDGRATGPGAFDMKAGLVQGIHALAGLDDLTGTAFLVTTDEEVGSPTSRALVESTARGARAALVLEPSAAGAVKSARKGVSHYELLVHGRAAHAGLEPEKGANAGVELATQLLRVLRLADAERGTTVTPTLLSAGTTRNTVPASGRVALDVRAAVTAEQERVDDALRSLRPPSRAPPWSSSADPTGHRSTAPRQPSWCCAPVGWRTSWVCRRSLTSRWAADRTATSPPASVSPPWTAWVRWATARTPRASTSWSTPCRSERLWSPDWSARCCAD